MLQPDTTHSYTFNKMKNKQTLLSLSTGIQPPILFYFLALKGIQDSCDLIDFDLQVLSAYFAVRDMCIMCVVM